MGAIAPAGRPIRRFSARIYASTYALSSIRCSFRSVSVTLSIDPTLTLADRLFLWHVEVFLLKAGVETAVSGASISSAGEERLLESGPDGFPGGPNDS